MQPFLLPDAVPWDPEVESWLDEAPGELGGIARHWFGVLRACGDDVREILHDGHPTACVGEVAFAYVNAFRAHVNVGFFYGAALPDPARLLEGKGRAMRHVKVRPGSDLEPSALVELIEAAYVDLGRRFRQ